MVVDNAARVNAYYWGVLGRAPDAEGFRFWVDKMDAGLGGEQLVRLFLNGAERLQAQPAEESASAFIDGCYGDLLGRSADADGKAFWLGRLETLGSTQQDARAAVVVEMIDYLTRPDGQSADQQLFQTRLAQWEPLTPGLALHEDTGVSATDGITRNGQVDVTLPEGVKEWNYSLDGGASWTPAEAGSSAIQLAHGHYETGSVQISYLDAGDAHTVANETNWTIDTYGDGLYLFTRGPAMADLLKFYAFGLEQVDQWRYSSDGGQTWQQGQPDGPVLSVGEGYYPQGSLVVETTDKAGNVSITAFPRDLTVYPTDITPPSLLQLNQHSYYQPGFDRSIGFVFDSSVQLGPRDLYADELFPGNYQINPATFEQAYLLDVTTGEQIGFTSAHSLRPTRQMLDITLDQSLEQGHQYSLYLPDGFVYDLYNNPMPELTILGANTTFIAA